jgi:hypothetical protein
MISAMAGLVPAISFSGAALRLRRGRPMLMIARSVGIFTLSE